jgi:hypothetical protein
MSNTQKTLCCMVVLQLALDLDLNRSLLEYANLPPPTINYRCPRQGVIKI